MNQVEEKPAWWKALQGLPWSLGRNNDHKLLQKLTRIALALVKTETSSNSKQLPTVDSGRTSSLEVSSKQKGVQSYLQKW